MPGRRYTTPWDTIKARVVSVTEKALQRRQVGDRKANTREPPFKCRKCSDDVETGE